MRHVVAPPPPKSKQIKRAHKALEKALEQHAELATASGVSLKKAQRANAKLAAAATAYADAVTAKTGLESPFSTGSVGLDGDTIASLQSERDDIERAVTGTIPRGGRRAARARDGSGAGRAG